MLDPTVKIAWIVYFTSKTNQPPLAGRHPFLTFTLIQSSRLKIAWISSPIRWPRCKSNLAEATLSQNYSTTCEKLPALTISRSNTALPSKPRGKLAQVELSKLITNQTWKPSLTSVWFQ